MKSDIAIVDCSPPDAWTDGIPLHDEESDDPTEREKAVWDDISQAFSAPVTHNDSIADYAPTQILAETFKSEGCAGIAYQSLLGKGKNIVLFDLDAAECVHIFLCKTDNISFNFRYVREDYQQMEPEVESE